MAADLHVPSSFKALVDDAAMFPPGNAPLEVAIGEHQRYRSSVYAPFVGPLLVRDTDVARLRDVADEPLKIGVIGTSGPLGLDRVLAVIHDFPHLTVAAYEIPLPPGDRVLAARNVVSALKGSGEITVSVELPRVPAGINEAWIKAADEVTTAGFQVKFRVGGVDASAYPSEQELAEVLGVLVHRPFKLTAGLHRAVRNSQPGTGFEQHGFLNVMVAVHRLLSGAMVDDAAQVLADRDGSGLAGEVRSWSEDDAAAVRRTFRGFGCCGVMEPYEDLVDLGLA